MAAAYALYSSATMVVLSLGAGAHGFTLDAARGEFVLTHPRLRIPARGESQTLARSFTLDMARRNFVLTHPGLRIPARGES